MKPHLTFACGTPHGGAVDSTVALAQAAVAGGFGADLVLAAVDPYEAGGRLEAVVAKVNARWPRLGACAWAAFDLAFSRAKSDAVGIDCLRTKNLPGSTKRVRRAGGVLIVNSVRRLDLDRLLALAARTPIPLVWYLREESALEHVTDFGAEVDALLANSRPLAAEASRRARRECTYVPSIVDRAGLAEPTERRSVLLVNAVDSYGLHETLAMAASIPDRQFVLQESWPLDAAAERAVSAELNDLPNVELRRRTTRDLVYRDARFMVAPHAPEAVGRSRPRVALEAQLLGIPLVAHDLPGLASVTASADNLVTPGSAPSVWAATFDRLDEDYERHSRDARRFADAEMPRADEVWSMFVAACGTLLSGGEQ